MIVFEDLNLLRMGGGGGGGGAKNPPTPSSPVTSTNVEISPKNSLAVTFNCFDTLM